MTFPTIPTIAAGRALTANQLNTTAARTFPDIANLTRNNGDLLIAIVVAYQSSTTNAQFTWNTGWNEIHDSGTSTTLAMGVAYRWADGTEITPVATQAATITGDASMILLSIPGAHATTPPEAGSRASGTTAAADPAAFNPAGWDVEDTLWISVVGSGMTSGTGSWTATGTTYPTNYTDGFDTNASDTSTIGDCEAGVSFRQLAAASEDVGTAGVDTSNARNGALVIAVRPAPAVLVDSPALELSSFGTFAEVEAGDTINHVTVSVRHKNASGANALTYQLWDGATAQIGATQTGTANTADHTDSFNFTGVTYSQLSTLRVRVYGHATSGLTESVDSVSLTVNYTPLVGTSATPAPPVAAGVASVGTVTINRTADVPATAVVAVAGVDLPVVATGSAATAQPPVVVALAAVPAPTIPVHATPAPPVVARAVAVPAPSITRTATTTPPTVAAVGAIGAMTGAVGVTVDDAPTVAGVAAVAAPTVQTAGNAAPQPPVVARAVVVPAPTMQLSASKTTTTVASVAAIAAPAIQRGTAPTPPTVAGSAAVPAPTLVTQGNATVTPPVVTALASVGISSIQRTATATPPVVAETTQVGVPTVSAGAGTTVAATTVARSVALPVPSVRTTATVVASTVGVTSAIASPSVLASANILVPSVTATAAVSIPVFHMDSIVEAQTVLANVAIGLVVVTGDTETPFYVWNGATLDPAVVTIWNGTTEDAIASVELAP